MVQFPQSGVGRPLLYISRDEWRVQAHYLFLLALNLYLFLLDLNLYLFLLDLNLCLVLLDLNLCLVLLALNLWQRQASVIHDGDCASIVDVFQTSLMCKL